MEVIRVHFGAEEPNDIDYREQADGFAEVWLYNNIGQDDDGFYADGVFFRTLLSKDEVEAQRDKYFVEQEPEVTVQDLVEAIDILSGLILEE